MGTLNSQSRFTYQFLESGKLSWDKTKSKTSRQCTIINYLGTDRIIGLWEDKSVSLTTSFPGRTKKVTPRDPSKSPDYLIDDITTVTTSRGHPRLSFSSLSSRQVRRLTGEDRESSRVGTKRRVYRWDRSDNSLFHLFTKLKWRLIKTSLPLSSLLLLFV